jgi:hypothetical protein
VFGGLNRALAAALVAGVALIAPSGALACSGGPSAVNVYKECVPSGGGSKPTSGGSKQTTTLPVSSRTARALTHAGKDKRVLSDLVRNPGLGGAPRALQSVGSASTKAPSALGSAFDLGSGPTALLAVLIGTALLLLGAGGFRGWRRWRGSS